MRYFTSLLAWALLVVAAAPAGAVGFQWRRAADPADKPLDIGIWYPSAAPVPDEPNTPFRQALAIDAPPSGERLPLVLVSHGYGGWLGGHAGTARALADAGFVVVAVTHTGNDYEDESYPASRWMVDRPRHVARVLDYMLAEWPDRGRLDPDRIGMFGFSAGAYTGMVAIGGAPNPEKVAAHCRSQPEELACTLGMMEGFAQTGFPPRSHWVHERRVRAAVLAAPGFGFAFDAAGLASVSVPVQLWAAAEDRSVPYATNTASVLAALPRPPDYRWVDNAGHFAFLAPCNPRLEAAQPKVWSMICVDKADFDRAAFHRQFNDDVVGFFRANLP